MGRTRTLTLVGLLAIAVLLAAVAAGLILARPGAAPAPTPVAVGATGVSGYLFQDRDGDGSQGPDERVLPGWSVRLYGTGPLPLQTTTTAEDGTFAFPAVEHLPAGVTEVELRFAPVLEGPAADHLPDPTALSERTTVALGSTTTVPVSSFRLCLSVDDCGALDLPDLVPQLTSAGGDDYPAPTETVIDDQSHPGQVLLRFATSTANLGGVLHVVGGPTTGDTQEIRQFAYGPGVVLDRAAGTFTYHPEHHHVHMDDFVRYDLLDASGSIVASSSKVSFCLTDILPADAAPRAEDAGVFLDLPPLECGSTEQGINSGQADYYGRDLPDQWVDVTGLPAGDYTLRFTVNPDRVLLESDYDDDVVEFPVHIP